MSLCRLWALPLDCSKQPDTIDLSYGLVINMLLELEMSKFGKRGLSPIVRNFVVGSSTPTRSRSPRVPSEMPKQLAFAVAEIVGDQREYSCIGFQRDTARGALALSMVPDSHILGCSTPTPAQRQGDHGQQSTDEHEP